MQTIKIVSGVIDEERLTLITSNGERLTIPQGDVRLRKILDFITGPITVNGEVDVPLELLDKPKEEELPYAAFEEASKGKVSFYRVAKKTVGRFIRSITGKKTAADVQHEQELSLANVVPTGEIKKAYTSPVETKKAAIEEIISKAIPATHPEFQSNRVERQKPVQENGHTDKDVVSTEFVDRMINDEVSDTIVAVVDGEIIPGMEMIESQFKHALQFGSTAGVSALLKRLGAVINKRGHAIDDVLRFMQRGDMRVDDKGNIIALKALYLAKSQGKANHTVEGAPDEQFVDCHSQNVYQWVGACVQMNESMVDHNRGQECSSGLHIARRGYLRSTGFGGHVCVLVLLNPEDVIAVPHYDANKVRACRYHIVARLTDEMFNLVKQNKPISDCAAGKVLLANVTAGNHIGVTHIVNIGGGYGSNLTITKVETSAPAPVLNEELTIEALPDNVVSDGVKDSPVSPVAAQATINLSRKDVAKQLYDAWVRATIDPLSNQETIDKSYAELLAHKKACKVGWDKLGLPSSPSGNVLPPTEQAKPAEKLKAAPKAKPKTKPTPKPKAAPAVKKQAKPKATEKPVKAKKPMNAPTPQAKSKTTPREDLGLLLSNKTPEQITISIAESANSVKQAAKKSWAALGVSPELEKAIKRKLEAGKW